jgi:hypothetical protein
VNRSTDKKSLFVDAKRVIGSHKSKTGRQCNGQSKIVERDKRKKIIIGWTNFAAVAIETKKGGLKMFWDSFHQTS